MADAGLTAKGRGGECGGMPAQSWRVAPLGEAEAEADRPEAGTAHTHDATPTHAVLLGCRALPRPSILGNAHFGATPIDSSLTSPVRPSSSKHACAAADAAAAGVPIHTGHCHANAKVAVALNMRGWKNS